VLDEQCTQQIPRQICIGFHDDILIYSKNREEHEEHIRLVLQVLRENQLYAKFIKCDFFHKQVHYLGHVISEEAVVVDTNKIRSIMEWPTQRMYLISNPLWA
jgi:hypothetical protein